jgi:polyphenol oxidase
MTLPPLPDAFAWTDASWGTALRCRHLPAGMPHAFTTRQLVLSEPGAADRLADAVEATAAVSLAQVHGRHVVIVRRDAPLPAEGTTGDIVVSDAPEVAIAVRAADCVPLLVADPVSGAVAAVHAGWRGTAAGAATAAVETLLATFGSRPADLLIAIGPAIGICCYEVGSDVVDAFAAQGHDRTHIMRWFDAHPPPRGSRASAPLRLDLALANRDQLRLAGVPEERIFTAGLCTAMHLDLLTSYRAERHRAGRLAAVIRARR